jgi:hypothetical protein
MVKVEYNGCTVSDPAVRDVLKQIAHRLGHDVIITSGDRDHAVKGGSPTSDHLVGRAADFHVRGMSDDAAFAYLKAHAQDLLRDLPFQVIQHGSYTATQGHHLHSGLHSNSHGSVFDKF